MTSSHARDAAATYALGDRNRKGAGLPRALVADR